MTLYPPIDPYENGLLDVGEGHRLYCETCGAPEGRPAVVLHGGPGSGCTPGWRRYFDPRAYKVVLFDQRGCGRSLPHAADPATDLGANTTHHLVADIERLRRRLGIERWLVFGGSWGTTLGLAYAQAHRERVSEMVLFSVGTTSAQGVDWITRGVGRFFPEAWARFREGVPPADRDGDLAQAYARLLADPEGAVREKAAKDWCDWEDSHVAIHPGRARDPRYRDPRFRMAFARLVTHYWSHAAWLEDGALIAGAAGLAGVPGVLVHGRLDVSSPPQDAWRLAQALPGAELTLVDDAGHGAGHPEVMDLLVAATNRFAGAGTDDAACRRHP